MAEISEHKVASSIEIAYSKLSDLNLYIKIRTGDELVLSDLSSIVKLRYPDLVANWGSYKLVLLDSINAYSDSYRLQSEIESFSSLVAAQLSGSTVTPSETLLLSKYYTIFDAMSIESTNISKIERQVIDSEVTRVSAFTKTTFLEMREAFIVARDEIADNMGGSDIDYNRIYSRSSKAKTLEKSIDELQASSQLQIAIESIDAILANQQILQSTAAIDPFAFARANANNPDFDIGQYASGTLVRMQYGETLQQLAQRTLGNPDRWYDIAIANGLKPPYVDEVGISLSLVSNGNGNRINISKTGIDGKLNRDRFYLNQIIILQSNTERLADQRIVRSISEVPVSGEIVLELSGAEDMDRYKASESANVRVFSPQTINSTFYVLIPGSAPLAEDQVVQDTPWFLRSKGEDEKQAGVDLYIETNGDLQFTPSGDIQLRYGADNAMQALLILLSTEVGILARHPEYGIATGIGDVNNNFAATRQKLAEAVSTQVLNDPRFSRLRTLQVELLSGASGYKVFLEAELAGSKSVIPVSFTVNINEK